MFPRLAGLAAFAVPLILGAPAAPTRRPQQASATGGAALYQSYCAACHGRTGRGDGALAAQLASRPSDLTILARRNGGAFPFEAVYRAVDGRSPIKAHGPMPAWAIAFGEGREAADQRTAADRITQLTQFVASIQRKPPATTPRSAVCVLRNPAFAGGCTETVEVRPGSTPGDACREILACLNDARCVKTYCSATTIRLGWTLESARAIPTEP